MRSSSLFFLVAGAIGVVCATDDFDITTCKDGSALVSCVQPISDSLNSNSCTTVSCACGLLQTEINCYKDNCPQATAILGTLTSGYSSKCASSKGAAGMLSAPVGLVAGVVGAMVLL